MRKEGTKKGSERDMEGRKGERVAESHGPFPRKSCRAYISIGSSHLEKPDTSTQPSSTLFFDQTPTFDTYTLQLVENLVCLAKPISRP